MNKDEKTESEYYTVLEMQDLAYSIRMELAQLKRFCKRYGLPLFVLKVEERITGGVSETLRNPYKKYFTIKWDWCLWAAEKSEEKAPEDEIKTTLQLMGRKVMVV